VPLGHGQPGAACCDHRIARRAARVGLPSSCAEERVGGERPIGGGARVERLSTCELASNACGRRRFAYPVAKRVLDVVASGAGLLFLSPLLAATGAAVKLTSPGPILFRQTRVGRHGHPFHILKFRSMRDGASGPAVTAGGDRRVTPLGRVLRRTKLDELPQLWNVLAGDMSVVGPRPEVPRYVERFPADYARILSIRPGLTDHAAVEYRDEESVLAAAPDPEAAYVDVVLPAKIALYHRYMDEMSLRTDLALVLRTLAAVLR
jgi:lipopolysaccharide/colanic/teichoic acid biosynthesis glycosyltransferase